MTHAGQLLHFVEIGANGLAAEDRTFLIDGVEHAGEREIDAVDWLAGGDVGHVDAGDRLADDLVLAGFLQLDGLEIRNRQGGGGGHRWFAGRIWDRNLPAQL